jgi:hypothetical protein
MRSCGLIHITAADEVAAGWASCGLTGPVDRRFVADADAEAHRRDAPRFCPRCGAAFDAGIATEFREAADRRFSRWCGGCGWTGGITPTGDVAVGHEPEH